MTSSATTKTTTTTPSLPPLGVLQQLPYHKLLDPTRVFSFLVFAVMFFRFLQSHNWSVLQLVQGFFLNPYVMVFFSAAVFVVYRGLKDRSKMAGNNKLSSTMSLTDTWRSIPAHDRWVAEWYWWNAWLYHGVMDGAAGTLQAVPVVVSQYHILDQRFVNGHSVPWTIGLIELLVMQPVCLWTLYAALTKSSWRFPLECVATTLHMFGAVVFVAAEVYEGQYHIPALAPIGTNEGTFANANFVDPYQFVYYWFGFWFCNLIWVWVPMIRLTRAVQECARALQMVQQQEKGVEVMQNGHDTNPNNKPKAT